MKTILSVFLGVSTLLFSISASAETYYQTEVKCVLFGNWQTMSQPKSQDLAHPLTLKFRHSWLTGNERVPVYTHFKVEPFYEKSANAFFAETFDELWEILKPTHLNYRSYSSTCNASYHGRLDDSCNNDTGYLNYHRYDLRIRKLSGYDLAQLTALMGGESLQKAAKTYTLGDIFRLTLGSELGSAKFGKILYGHFLGEKQKYVPVSEEAGHIAFRSMNAELGRIAVNLYLSCKTVSDSRFTVKQP